MRYLRALITSMHPDVNARVLGQLFPVVPVAMAALREVLASGLEETAAWIEAHCSEPELREHISPLRAHAERVRRTSVMR
jgi:hypothetical protein